jgi:biotin-dependent carboxylase-like uncharacterized protein
VLTVVRATGLASVQDLGWTGHRSIGLPPGGAMDPDGLRLGNALVGNPAGAAGLELAQGELVLAFEAATAVAVWGGAVVRLNGVAAPTSTNLAIPKGGRLEIASAAGRRFVLVAIQGGIDVPVLLGSRSTYLPTALGGFEGRRLMTGDQLRRGPRPPGGPAPGTALSFPRLEPGPIRVAPGPQAHLFGTDVCLRFSESAYRVAVNSDRMGTRLEGLPLAVKVTATLPSEATCLGAIQIPDDGQPIVILRDGPTVGGYPKIGAVISPDLARFAQLAPGNMVRFEWVSTVQAGLVWRRSEADLTAALASVRGMAPPV